MYCILICDDDRDIVSALDIYLTSEGYQTLHAYDGLEAIRMVEQNDVDLILMDVMMPEMNGLEATRCIRAFEGKGPGEGTPIIAMTANVFADDVKACLDAGMNSHVGKPLDMKVLIGEILKYTDAR